MKLLKYSLSLILILILTGCQINKNQTDVKPDVKQQVIEIEFWTLQLGSFEKYIKNIIKNYEKQNPKVKIKWIDVPFSEGEKRALASIMSKNVPDLINLNPDFASTLASRSALLFLDDILTKEEKSKYILQAWEANQINGKAFGIPWYVTTSVTFYNKKILQESGLKENDYPKTYKDFYTVSNIIKNKTGKYALFPSLTENGKMLKIFNKYNSINLINDKINFYNKENVELLDFWKKLYQENLIPKESLTQGHRDSLEKFMSGETAFIVTGGNFAKIIKENSPTVYKNLGIDYQITGNNNKYDFSIMNLVIPKRSKHPLIAKNFGLYLTNELNQLEFSKLAPVMPSTIESLNSSYFNTQGDNILSKARYISAKQLKKALSPIFVVENKTELNEIIDNMVQEVLLDKNNTNALLKKAQNDWNKINQ